MTKHLGILGGGQLGCMLAEAAELMGIPAVIATCQQDISGQPRASTINAKEWSEALNKVCVGAQAVTWEREDIPLDILRSSSQPILPAPTVLELTQDRYHQKSLFDRLGLATAPWRLGDSKEYQSIINELGLPLMVKARRGGFDGRGQILVHDAGELEKALDHFSATGSIVEQCISFDSEFAALITRASDGTAVHYPLVLTQQHKGQLNWAISPHPDEALLSSWAQASVLAIANAINHVGTIAMECFRCGDQVMVNEIAPRVHNSGHASIEGCETSQFANHVRAVCGLELGSAQGVGTTLMLNCIGKMPARINAKHVHYHDYHKSEKPERKVGHITILADNYQSLQTLVKGLPAELLHNRNTPFSQT